MNIINISSQNELNDAIDQANLDAPNPTTINFNVLSISTPGAFNTVKAPITFNCNGCEIIGSGSNFVLFTMTNIIGNVYVNNLKVDMNSGGSAFFIEDSDNVYFNNVEIINGNYDRGAIFFNRSTILELNNCMLSNNFNNAPRAGAIECNSSLTLRMNHCIISDNTNSFGNGGAINCLSVSSCEISNCEFSANNSRFGTGGACSFAGSSSTLVTLSDCTFTNNHSGNGGAIDVTCPITISNCIISNNTAIGSGGGIYGPILANNMIITNSTIKSNQANNGGGCYFLYDLVSIQNTTISNNIANNNGGGIYSVSSKNLQIINSTISSNISNNNGSAVFFTGIQSPKQLTNVTISNNTSNNNVNAGVYCDTNHIAVLNNTIVANNNSTSLNRDVFGNFTDSKNNLIGTVGSAIGFDPIDGNLIGVNPMLGQLNDYGGPTQTMALLAGSPAIDSGNNNLVPNGTLYDQRGPPFSRFSGTSVDIGAFEFNNMVICVSGDSTVYVKHIITNVIQYVHIKDIKPCDYHVYNTAIKDFVPIKLNIVTGKVDRFILLEKDVLSTNMPNCNLYITSGHMLLIDGKEIKARDVKQGKVVKTQPQLVYSICTQTRCPILINGLSVMTWGIDQWLNYAKSIGISWYDNK